MALIEDFITSANFRLTILIIRLVLRIIWYFMIKYSVLCLRLTNWKIQMMNAFNINRSNRRIIKTSWAYTFQIMIKLMSFFLIEANIILALVVENISMRKIDKIDWVGIYIADAGVIWLILLWTRLLIMWRYLAIRLLLIWWGLSWLTELLRMGLMQWMIRWVRLRIRRVLTSSIRYGIGRIS